MELRSYTRNQTLNFRSVLNGESKGFVKVTWFHDPNRKVEHPPHNSNEQETNKTRNSQDFLNAASGLVESTRCPGVFMGWLMGSANVLCC